MAYVCSYLTHIGQLSQVTDHRLVSMFPKVADLLACSTAGRPPSLMRIIFKNGKHGLHSLLMLTIFPQRIAMLHLVNLLQSACRYSTISSAFYAMNYFHKACGVPNSCVSPFLKSILQGCKCLDAAYDHTPHRKSPILPVHLVALVSQFGGRSASLSDIRDVTLCLVGFAGFLCYSEISDLKWCNVTFHDSCMSIFLSRSKTDQLHVGSSVVIAKTGHVTCPNTMLLRSASMAQVDLSSEQYIFGALTFHRRTNSYSIRPGSPLSYTRTREVIRQKLKAIGLDTSNIGLYS